MQSQRTPNTDPEACRPRPSTLLTLPADRVEMLADLAHYALTAAPKDKDAALKMIRDELSQALGMQRGRG